MCLLIILFNIQGVPKRYIHTSNNCSCEHFEEEDFYFQQDGALPHYYHEVTSFLNERLPKWWIGSRGFVEYPPCSTDLTLLDFFLWGYLKDKVFASKPTTLAELRATIECECMQIPREVLHDVCYSIASRYRRCLDQNGYQFEKRLWQNDGRILLNSFTCWKWNK